MSSSMFHENARRLTPIWLAARPARPSWSTVSSRSSTSALTRSSISVIGSHGARRTGAPPLRMSRIAMASVAHGRAGVPNASAGRGDRAAPGLPPREQAAAEEGALQGAVPVHAAAPESGCLSRGEQPGEHGAVGAQHPRVEVGLDAAEGLAGEDAELDRDERPGGGVEEPVRGGDPHEAVPPVGTGL